ncbi:MAG TPA: CPBP family intramembrane metalloprotease [Clostridiaceae bacterium]|nr:CPBP family intramembrane metalloprotease [Clostridiaceae bacterium]
MEDKHNNNIRPVNKLRSENTIRPTRIRIVNPTPKTSQTLVQQVNKNSKWQKKLNLLFFIVLGCLIFLLLDLFNIWSKIIPGVFTWKSLTVIQIVFLFSAFVLPSLIYILIKPQFAVSIKLTVNPLTALLSILIGFPFAYIMALLNLALSILLERIGILENIIIFDKQLQLFPANNTIYLIVYLLIICLIPAILTECSLRGIVLEELLLRKKQNRAIFFCAAISGLLTFEPQEFIPYFGLGMLVSMLYLYHQSIIATILCHLTFNLTYYYLILKIPVLNLNLANSSVIFIEDMIPLIIKGLIAITLFIPLFVTLSQTKKINPLLDSDKIIERHSKKKEPGNKFFNLSFVALIILFIVFVII